MLLVLLDICDNLPGTPIHRRPASTLIDLAPLDDIIAMLNDTEKFDIISHIDKDLDPATCWRLINEADSKTWTKEQKSKINKFCTTLFGNLDVVNAVASKNARTKEAEFNYATAMQNATKTMLVRDTAAVSK